jgi:EmrB/QacA subfamily drug resistance transporter
VPSGSSVAARVESPVAARQSRPSLVLGVILAVQLMVVLDATIVNIALPDIQASLGFSQANLSWVVNAYTLAFGGLLLLGARAGDLLGRRRTFIAGIALFTVASFAGGLAPWSGWLLAARAAQGAGGALAAPSALALLMTMFADGRERVRALGWYTAVSIGGAAVGLIAGGLLTQWASWRWVLFVNVPVGVAVLMLARATVSETPTRAGRFDLPGAVTSTVGVTSLAYGFVRAATTGWGDPAAVGAFAIGALLLVAFVAVEARAVEPITPLRLFADRSRSSSYVARLLLIAGTFGMFFFLTQFLQDVLGYSPLRAGLAFLPLTVALFAASQFSARVVTERFGVKRVIVGGLLLSTMGLLWLTQLSETSGYISVLGPLLLFGTGNGLAFVPLTSVSLAGVAPADAGAASGLVNVMQQLGGALGLAVLVSIFGSTSRDAAAHPQFAVGSVAEAHRVFVTGADHAFTAAVIFLVATVAVVGLAIRSRSRSAALETETAAERRHVDAESAPQFDLVFVDEEVPVGVA